MQRLITVGIVLALLVYGFRQYRGASEAAEREQAAPASGLVTEVPASAPAAAGKFRCDGRTHCSQMTSCEEAYYFLRNCPGVKMDGGGDGVPCERQWCGNR
jgi:hypothetical protein